MDPSGDGRLDRSGKEIDLDQSEIIFRVRTQKGPNRFGGNIFATSQGNVRMPRPEVRFESGRERGIGHALVQLKEMRVARPHSEPNDPRAAARRKVEMPRSGRKNAPKRIARRWSRNFSSACGATWPRKASVRCICSPAIQRTPRSPGISLTRTGAMAGERARLTKRRLARTAPIRPRCGGRYRRRRAGGARREFFARPVPHSRI